MVNSIAYCRFLSLQGDPQALTEQPIVLARPGVPGVAIWLTSARGRRFTLRSGVDAEDLGDARAMLANYQELIGTDPVALVWRDVPMTREGFSVCVLDVRPVRVMPMLRCVGGTHPPSRAWLEADWDLIAVASGA